VANLLRFSVLKSTAQRLGIEAIDRRQGAVNIKFHQESKIDPVRLMNLVSHTAGAQFTPAGVLRLPLDSAGPEPAKILEFITERLEHLG
jgi:transcription-repair coupling factor (superfamily II helicase)